jgi:hypothetical protein
MGSEDKFFLISGCTHSSSNQVIWWRNNKVISLKREMGLQTNFQQKQAIPMTNKFHTIK